MLRLAWLIPALVGTVGGAWAAEPITIGEINSRTGVLAVQGTAVHEGIRLALEETNARGGIGGRLVALLSRDDEGKPERAIAAAEELASHQRAVALIGGYGDSLVGPVSEVADRSRIPYLATASLDERLALRGNRFFFRISSLASYAKVTTGIVLEVFRARNVAILYSSTPGASQLARRQKEALEQAAVRVSVFEPFAPGLSDFAPLLARVRDRGADVLLSDTFFADHLLLVRQMAQAGVAPKAFLGAFGMEFPGVIQELGSASEGLYGTTAWQPGVYVGGNAKDSQAFTEAFLRRVGREPAPLAMHGYAAARTLLRAIEAVVAGGKPLTGEALREALVRSDVETPLGRVKFDDNGDPLFYERVVIQIQRGRYVVVYPRERATAAARYPAR